MHVAMNMWILNYCHFEIPNMKPCNQNCLQPCKRVIERSLLALPRHQQPLHLFAKSENSIGLQHHVKCIPTKGDAWGQGSYCQVNNFNCTGYISVKMIVMCCKCQSYIINPMEKSKTLYTVIKHPSPLDSSNGGNLRL